MTRPLPAAAPTTARGAATWSLLGAAIGSEVAGTLSLRAALDHPVWFVGSALGYVVAFGLLGVVLRRGVPVGAAYGIWAAAGVALTAVTAGLLFGEPFTAVMAAGLVLVVVGVLLVESGSRPAPEARDADRSEARDADRSGARNAERFAERDSCPDRRGPAS